MTDVTQRLRTPRSQLHNSTGLQARTPAVTPQQAQNGLPAVCKTKTCSQQLTGNAVCQQAAPWQQVPTKHMLKPHCRQKRNPNTPLIPLCVLYGMGGWWVCTVYVRAQQQTHAQTHTQLLWAASTPITYCLQVQCVGSPPNQLETPTSPSRCHTPCLLQAGHTSMYQDTRSVSA